MRNSRCACLNAHVSMHMSRCASPMPIYQCPCFNAHVAQWQSGGLKNRASEVRFLSRAPGEAPGCRDALQATRAEFNSPFLHQFSDRSFSDRPTAGRPAVNRRIVVRVHVGEPITPPSSTGYLTHEERGRNPLAAPTTRM